MFVCRSHRTNTSCIRGSYTTWTNMYVWRHNHQTQRVFPDVMTSEYNPSETWAAILTRSTSDLSVLSRNSERLLPGHTCSRCVCWFNLSAHSDRRLISQLWRRSIGQSEDFNLSLTSEADSFTCLTSPEPEPSGCNMILNNGAVWWCQESQNELKMFEIQQMINYSVNNTDLKGAVHPKLTVQSSSPNYDPPLSRYTDTSVTGRCHQLTDTSLRLHSRCYPRPFYSWTLHRSCWDKSVGMHPDWGVRNVSSDQVVIGSLLQTNELLISLSIWLNLKVTFFLLSKKTHLIISSGTDELLYLPDQFYRGIF